MIISLPQLTVFLLIIARIAGIFLQAPIFTSRSFPVLGKVTLAIWITLLLWFVVPIYRPLPAALPLLMLALVFEVALGFVIGFMVNFIFLALQAAGEIMDMQMGLSVATALDPIFGSVISIIGRLAFYIALIFFLAVNGHHLILSALHQSFTIIPVGKFANFTSPHLAMQMISLGTALWRSAIQLAGPIILMIFLIDFSFGIISRVAPQVNVFMLGFQVKPMVGLLGFSLCLPFIVKYFNHQLEFMTQQLILLLNNIK
ncbi:flagellar biosynthetic protein FliR [Candidatus Saganbacteria bacterium]|nr:flagellar biosynthetic protein FliR [Candidatus Saganbacteria bacterium]